MKVDGKWRHTEEEIRKLSLYSHLWTKGAKQKAREAKIIHPVKLMGERNPGYIDGKHKQRSNRKMLGRSVFSRVVWCRYNQIYKVPFGYVIHHLDLNPENNNPTNLQILPDNMHKSFHADIVVKAIKGESVLCPYK